MRSLSGDNGVRLTLHGPTYLPLEASSGAPSPSLARPTIVSSFTVTELESGGKTGRAIAS